MRRNAIFITLCVLGALLGIASPVQGQSNETIHFEDHPTDSSDGDSVLLNPDFYAKRGIHFKGGTVVEYSDGFAGSGTHAWELCYVQIDEGPCTSPFRIDFDARLHTVAISIGYRGTQGTEASVFMVAMDENGEPLDEDGLALAGPLPVEPQLVVSDLEGNIASVEIGRRDADGDVRGLVVDDIAMRQLAPVHQLTHQPQQLDLTSMDELGEIVITNIGEGTASLSGVDLLEEPAEFAMADTDCEGMLIPGDSCTVFVRFIPTAAGDYASTVVLYGPTGEPLYSIPIFGSLIAPEPTPSTTRAEDAADETSPPTTSANPTPLTTGAGGGRAEQTAPQIENAIDAEDPTSAFLSQDLLLVVIVVVAVSGSRLLYRLRPRRASQAREATPSVTATLTLTPERGAHQVATDDRQPVAAVRIAMAQPIAMTALIEEETT